MAELQGKVMRGRERTFRGGNLVEVMCGNVEDRDRLARQCEESARDAP